MLFLNMMLKAWNTYLWDVSLILPCRTSQAPPGWMACVGLSLGSGWGTQQHSERILKPLLPYFGRVLIELLLEDELSPQSKVQSAQEQVTIKDVFLFALFTCPSTPTSLPVLHDDKLPHSIMEPLPCFTRC